MGPSPNNGVLKGLPLQSPFCPLIEARLMTNGKEMEELNYPLRIVQFLQDTVARSDLQSMWAYDAIRHRVSKKVKTNKETARRRSYVDLCHDRYKKGIPFNVAALQDEKLKLEERSRQVIQTLPPNLIDYRGVVNSEQLSHALPLSLRAEWPKDYNGQLIVSKEALALMDNEWAHSLLEAKSCRRDQLLRNFCVDEDGRHRNWPNPFGTKTGRDRPLGASFIYLPKHYRALIQPDQGSVVALIDYEQQEPAIAAIFSGHAELITRYEMGDLYAGLLQEGPWDRLSRKQFKRLLISYLYGRDPSRFCADFGVDSSTAQGWDLALGRLLGPIENWMDTQTAKAFSEGRVASLDWQMWVSPRTNPLSVRNWPIQAAGADILRRACFQLADAGIAVIGGLHDAVLIEVPVENHQQHIAMAEKIMRTASAEVLSGVRLKTKVEQLYWSVCEEPVGLQDMEAAK